MIDVGWWVCLGWCSGFHFQVEFDHCSHVLGIVQWFGVVIKYIHIHFISIIKEKKLKKKRRYSRQQNCLDVWELWIVH